MMLICQQAKLLQRETQHPMPFIANNKPVFRNVCLCVCVCMFPMENSEVPCDMCFYVCFALPFSTQLLHRNYWSPGVSPAGVSHRAVSMCGNTHMSHDGWGTQVSIHRETNICYRKVTTVIKSWKQTFILRCSAMCMLISLVCLWWSVLCWPLCLAV